MSDSVQPGTEIDADVWREFREEVERRRGGVRGHLRTELENALRAYTEGGEATPADVDKRLARIEAAVGVNATDGGTHPSQPAEYTHTPNGGPDEKPHAKSASEDKLAWLANQYVSEYGKDGSIDRFVWGLAREVVEDEYSFNEDVTERYVERMVAHFGMVQHPNRDETYVTEDRYDEIVEQRREQARKDAQERTENL